uniref:Uncharacterized protein n=1 Tax=Arundo donax TaxID=35708 RepID=A0A0A9S198_ARUDO
MDLISAFMTKLTIQHYAYSGQ